MSIGREAALGASGYSWEDLGPCVNWMAPFAAVVKKHDVPDVLPGISGVSDEARHLIQSHSITLAMLVIYCSLKQFFYLDLFNHNGSG